MIKIKYFHTGYKKDVECNVLGNIKFIDGYAHFASGGWRYAVEVEYIKKIEIVTE